MILSDDCWMKGICWKYQNSDAECKTNNIFCPKLFKMDFLYKEACISDKQRLHMELRIDSDGTDKQEFKILKSVENNIENFVNTGCNLYIHSSTCGNGKTSWAIRLLQTYLGKVWYKSDFECKALFVNVPKFLLALKDNISEKNDYAIHVKENIMSADLVIFDEISAKVATTYENENLLNIINCRIDSNKSNIYTSNAQPDELRDKLGERLYSRVINCSTCVQLSGRDKRNLIFNGGCK